MKRPPSPIVRLIDALGRSRPLAEIEAAAIAYALEHAPTRCAAAKALGIGRSTLYRKIAEAKPQGRGR